MKVSELKTRSLKAKSTYSVIHILMSSRRSLTVSTSDCESEGRGLTPPLTHICFSQFSRKWLYQTAKYHQIRDRQVRFSRKRHPTCLYRTIMVLAAILGEKKRKCVRAVLNKTGSYRLILLISNSK